MASLKKLAPLLALGAVIAAAGGGFAYYEHLEKQDGEKREQLFADLSACLMGKVLTSDADALADYAAQEAWTMHRPPEMRGKAQGGPWPDRCGARVHAMIDAARDSAFLDKDTKVAQLDAFGILAKDLDAQEKQRTPCAGDVASLWRQANEQHWSMASSSTVAGPQRPSVMAGGAEAPFASLLPLEGGPEWAFLTEPKDKGPLGFCSLTATGLKCVELKGEGHVSVAGPWESPSFIPLLEGGELVLLHDGARELTGIKGAARDAYVDGGGTIYALSYDSEVQLSIKALGKKARQRSLSESFSGYDVLPEGAADRARLVGRSLLVASDGGVFLMPIDDKGAVGTPRRIEGARGNVGSVCRSGPSIVVRLTTGTVLFLDDQGDAKTLSAQGSVTCGKSGEVWVGAQLCRATGCHDPLPASIRERLHESAAVGLVGDEVVTAWLVSAGRGMLARVAPDGDASDTPDVVIAPKTDVEPHQRVAIFGGPTAALALAETKSGLIGAHITADGKVEPIRLDPK